MLNEILWMSGEHENPILCRAQYYRRSCIWEFVALLQADDVWQVNGQRQKGSPVADVEGMMTSSLSSEKPSHTLSKIWFMEDKPVVGSRYIHDPRLSYVAVHFINQSQFIHYPLWVVNCVPYFPSTVLAAPPSTLPSTRSQTTPHLRLNLLCATNR